MSTADPILPKIAISLNTSFQSQAIERFSKYLELIARWNKAYNLTAVRKIEDMVSLHLLDSLAVLPYLESDRILDVGAGAGLPGIPLAIASPEREFALNDSNGKKTRFMTQAKIELKLDNVEVVHARIEDHQPETPYDGIISRAFADTDKFLACTEHLQNEGACTYVMQGKLDTLISRPGYRLVASHELEVPGLDAERHLLKIKRQNVA